LHGYPPRSGAWRLIPLTWNPCHLGKIHPSKDEEALLKNKKITLYMLRVVSLDPFWS